MIHDDCDIVFVCEHWLKPCDIPTVQMSYQSNNMWTNIKSGMQMNDTYIGRPYGGVGFIARKMANITVRDLMQDDDRISVIELRYNSMICLTVIGVYMPYHSNSSCIAYSETLDKIQGIINNVTSPFMIVGDMNASLPSRAKLQPKWHMDKPYNKHSLLLYDMICNNELISANFSIKQTLKYTYFKGLHRTYIDHVFICKSARLHLYNCVILPENTDLSSDHLPIKTTLEIIHLEKQKHILDEPLQPMAMHAKVDWSRDDTCRSFTNCIKNISGSLNTNYNDVTDSKEAQQSVNTICSDVIACINHATREVNPIQDSKKNKFQKALSWWSRSTATAKNRKSFWYKIWLDCEKPRSGHTYECYKLAKAAYRRAHRLAFNKHVNSTFSTLNYLHKVNNSREFWKVVNKARNTKNDQSDDISLSQLVSFYKNKFAVSKAEGQVIQDARDEANEKYAAVRDTIYKDSCVPVCKLEELIKQLSKNSSPDMD